MASVNIRNPSDRISFISDEIGSLRLRIKRPCSGLLHGIEGIPTICDSFQSRRSIITNICSATFSFTFSAEHKPLNLPICWSIWKKKLSKGLDLQPAIPPKLLAAMRYFQTRAKSAVRSGSCGRVFVVAQLATGLHIWIRFAIGTDWIGGILLFIPSIDFESTQCADS